MSDIRYPVAPFDRYTDHLDCAMLEQLAASYALQALGLSECEIQIGTNYATGEFERWLRSGAPAIPQRWRSERTSDPSAVAA